MKHSGIAVILPHREGYQAVGGGAVAYCIRDIAACSRYLSQLHVFGDPVDTPFEWPPFEPISLVPPNFRRRTLRYLLAIRKRMQAFRPTLVEVHNRPLIALDQLRHSTGYPVLLYLHNDPLDMRGFAEVKARRELLDRGGYVVGVSDHICQRFLDGIEGHPNRRHVVAILNGVDTRQPVFNDVLEKRKEVLFVGRIIPEKGSLIYAQAMKNVLDVVPDWRAVMIGGRTFDAFEREKPYDAEVMECMRSLGAQAELTGYLSRDEVLARMASAAIVVVPSLWDEPCGLVAIEALACGCAVIASGKGGLPDVVGDAGVLLDDLSVAALSREVLTLIDNEDQRADFQARARHRARHALDVRITSGKLDDLRMGMLSWPVKPAD